MKPLPKAILGAAGAAALLSLSAYFAVHSYQRIKNMSLPFGENNSEYERGSIVWTCLSRTSVRTNLIKTFDPIAANDPQKAPLKTADVVQLPALDTKELADFNKCANNAFLNGELGGDKIHLQTLFLPVMLLALAMGSGRASYRFYKAHKASKAIDPAPAFPDNKPE